MTGGHCGVAALDAADDAAGFTHHDQPGCDVPRLEIALPVSIEASGGVDDFATYSVTFKGDGDLVLK